MGVWYTTIEDVQSALDSKETARNAAQIARQIEGASRSIEGFLHRKFYPLVATRYFAWPNIHQGVPWRLWLDGDELISVTTLTSGGVTIASSDYFLEPANSGPPYTHVEIDLDSSAYFGGSSTHQRSVAITGLFGYSNDEVSIGTLAEDLDSSETDVDVSDSSTVGIGDIIRVDSERMIVTGKSMLDTGANLVGSSTAQQNDTTQIVDDASGFHEGEIILMDSERMLIVDISGNNLTVKRAWDGSVLGSHNNSDIYAPRTLRVDRGVLGTTAATHDNGTAIARFVVPGLIKRLCTAEALGGILQENSGFAQVVSNSDTGKTTAPWGMGLPDLRKQAYAAHGRKARTRAV